MAKERGPCVFCEVVAGRAPANVVWENGLAIAIMDIAPMRPGHVLVVNRRHTAAVEGLTAPERDNLLRVGDAIGRAQRSLGAHGVNFAINDGRAAHQTVPHVHLHVLPRRRGDVPALIWQVLCKPVRLLLPSSRTRLQAQAARIAAAMPLAASD
ncbi:MAG: HIT family protein [Pseudomonadota bacterium]|nr:HIT family protein [Pseudomonadota bacterium]HJO34971.1 HIT family protein [Gammaproteobacteria bacterium]